MTALVPLYRVWWPVLDITRLCARALVERWRASPLFPLAFGFRIVGHLLAANPWAALPLTLLWLVGVSRPIVLAGAVWMLAVEAGLRLLERRSRWVAWVLFARRGLGFRRRWPRRWDDYAGRTRRVQAETGKEPSTPVRYRPIVDHPRISWPFLVNLDEGSVSFLVGPPPDRTFGDLAQALPALAAGLSWVESVELDYETARSSFGELRVFFADPLAKVQAASWDEEGSWS